MYVHAQEKEFQRRKLSPAHYSHIRRYVQQKVIISEGVTAVDTVTRSCLGPVCGHCTALWPSNICVNMYNWPTMAVG